MRFTLEQGGDHLCDVVDQDESDAVIRTQTLGKFCGQIVFEAGNLIIAINVIGVRSVVSDNYDFLAFPGVWQRLDRLLASG